MHGMVCRRDVFVHGMLWVHLKGSTLGSRKCSGDSVVPRLNFRLCFGLRIRIRLRVRYLHEFLTTSISIGWRKLGLLHPIPAAVSW